MSPMAYFRAKRLSHVRTELRAMDRAWTTVREVALRWGFHHAGQFAQDYSRHYDERPCDTLLKQRAPRTAIVRRSGRTLVNASSPLRPDSLQEPSETPRAPSQVSSSVPRSCPGLPMEGRFH